MGEGTLVHYGDVTVDDRFARFGSKSYAINKINSVDVRSATVSGSSAYWLWWLLAVLFAFTAIGSQQWWIFIIVVVLILLGAGSWEKRHSTTTYSLFLVTSSNEAQAFSSADEHEVQRLRTSIEDAMARSS